MVLQVAEIYFIGQKMRALSLTICAALGLSLVPQISAFAEAQHDKVPADPNDNFWLDCKAPDSIIHILVSSGEISDVKITLPNHKVVDRNEQYPMHGNSFKEADAWYVWTGIDKDFKHYMRGNLIHTDSIFTYQEIRHAIGPNGDWSDTNLVVDTSNCGGD